MAADPESNRATIGSDASVEPVSSPPGRRTGYEIRSGDHTSTVAERRQPSHEQQTRGCVGYPCNSPSLPDVVHAIEPLWNAEPGWWFLRWMSLPTWVPSVTVSKSVRVRLPPAVILRHRLQPSDLEGAVEGLAMSDREKCGRLVHQHRQSDVSGASCIRHRSCRNRCGCREAPQRDEAGPTGGA